VHGGSIKARNAAQGTIVEFMLPLDETPELVRPAGGLPLISAEPLAGMPYVSEDGRSDVR
jgi:hypothetical protein